MWQPVLCRGWVARPAGGETPRLLVQEGKSDLTITQWGDILGETFGDDPRMLKTELDYVPTSGVKLQATPGKTTTVLGTYRDDTGQILKELGNVKSTDLSGRTGYFNLLNTPDELYDTLGGDRFWEMYNKPWLELAIKRNDVFVMATEPSLENCTRYDQDLNINFLSGFGREYYYREYYYLIGNGYVYDPTAKQMIPWTGG